METIKALYNKVTDLHQLIEKNRYEAEFATRDSLHHGEAEEYNRATDEASHAMRLVHEIGILQNRVIAIEQQIIEVEKHILQLQQHEAMIREDCLHHVSHIDHETMQKLDEVVRQIKTLRG